MSDPDSSDADVDAADLFVPPSVHAVPLLAGESYSHFSPVPRALLAAPPPPCCLGVDEAGRGPVLGPMVYAVFYVPLGCTASLLREQHGFDDSKVLSAAERSRLMRALCRSGAAAAAAAAASPSLHSHCGWATTALSARDISARMQRPGGAHVNLNAQALEATVALVRGVLARGVRVAEVYVDTVGPPAAYQRRLEQLLPSVRLTVAKKADALYPCVSAASVCAKTTRDASLAVLHSRHAEPAEADAHDRATGHAAMAWGSGYPSDARCTAWLRRNMHPLFGWGPECRFSWGTAKDMLMDTTGAAVKVDWPVDRDEDTARLTDWFAASGDDAANDSTDHLGTWFGTPVGLGAF